MWHSLQDYFHDEIHPCPSAFWGQWSLPPSTAPRCGGWSAAQLTDPIHAENEKPSKLNTTAEQTKKHASKHGAENETFLWPL